MPETSKMNSVGELFSGSWRLYKERFAVLIKIAVIPALFIALGSIASSQGFPAGIFGSLFGITGTVLAIFASIAIVIALEHKTDLNESYRKSAAIFWPYLWISILSALAVIGGFVMLIVPGIILSVALMFSRFVLILENRRGLNSLTQSRAYVKGYWWATLGRYLLLGLCCGAILLIIYLPAILILGKVIGTIVYAALLLLITPFSLVYTYQIYKNLVALKPEVHANQATAGKTFLTASAIVGFIAPVVFIILFIVFIAVFAKHYFVQYQAGSAVGMHCGGFIQNAPTCPSGYHCQLNIRTPDTGGVCLPDLPSLSN